MRLRSISTTARSWCMKSCDGKIFFQRIINAVKSALLQAGKIEGRFAKCFAGNSSGVDTTAANRRSTLDNGNALAEIGRLSGTFFASGATADDQQVK